MKLKNLAVASALALTSISIAPLPASAQQTHLSQCMRNGLLGAGAGAVLGALTSHHHQLQSAAVGAAVGGVGTWAVCRMLTHSDERRVERGYQRSLAGDRRYNDSWGSGNDAKNLYVSRPTSAGNGCKRVSATISDLTNGRQELPPETFCRNSQGQWIPTDS
jgi:hypothetical protein